jgi:hypothetical protein
MPEDQRKNIVKNSILNDLKETGIIMADIEFSSVSEAILSQNLYGFKTIRHNFKALPLL